MNPSAPTPGGDPSHPRPDRVRPSFPVDVFAGTAPYYVRYRLPYPRRLLMDLVERSDTTGAGRLLDLACGPGRLALALAASFQEIWAIDIEPEMIDAGRERAGQQGVKNVKWIVGRAEDLDTSSASFDLITIGEAFHRLDQERVAAQALLWLKPGCRLATLGCYTILSEKEPWQRIVADIVRRWSSRLRRDGDGPGAPKAPGGPGHDERVMREAGFVEVGSYPFVKPHNWTVEAILGYLYSTSVCSKAVLGKNVGAFEAELEAALLAHDAGGNYREDIEWGYTLGAKPN